MIPFALTIILGVIQLALVFNAQTMLELAAFNAARAAIVTQGEEPHEPATVEQAMSNAHRAALVTLLPVIPALHGTTPSLQGVESIISGASLENPLSGSTGALLEIPRIRVDFIDPKGPINGAAIDDWPNRIDFDDPNHADDNVVKVRVSWDYPLVIPFINRIFAAIANPGLYLVYQFSIQNGRDPTPEEILRLFNRPAWDYAGFLSRPTGNPLFDNPLFQKLLLLRWPMNATQVMRMQWDRKPND